MKILFSKNIKKTLKFQLLDIKDLKLPRVLKYTDRLSMINGIKLEFHF